MKTLQLVSILATALLYFGFFRLNTSLFQSLKLHTGANWIFLPAGLRLVCTLVLGGEAAIGLGLAAIAIIALDFPELDPVTAVGLPMISAGAPYLVYRLALRAGLTDSLANLTTSRLMLLGLAYALASAGLHALWYALRGFHTDLVGGFVTMFVGDLVCTLIMLYAMKMALALMRRRRSS